MLLAWWFADWLYCRQDGLGIDCVVGVMAWLLAGYRIA